MTSNDNESNDLEKKLKETENSYRRLSKNLPGIVYRVLIKENNRTIFFNDMFKSVTGYTSEELVQGEVCSIEPLIDQKDKGNVISVIKDAINEDLPFEVEYRLRHKDGSIKWLLERGRPTQDIDGNPEFIEGVIFDITDRKDAEQKLRESEEKFRTLAEQSNMGIVLLQDNSLKYVNRQFAEIFGYTQDELLNLQPGEFINLIHPEDRDLVKKRALQRQVGELADIHSYQYRGIKKSSEVIWLDAFAKTINYEGRSAGFATYIEITDRKKAEQKLKDSEEKYRKISERYEMLLESITDAVFVINNDWEYTLVNKLAEKIVNMPVEKLLGNKITDVFPGIESTPFFKTYETVMNTRMPKRVRDTFLLPDGQKGYYEVSVYPISEGILCIGRNVTEEVVAEQKLKDSEANYRDAYERAEFYKDLFAHDISNILQNIKSSLGLLSMWRNVPEKTDKITELMNIINDQLIRGSKLVSNIRRLSEITETESHIESLEALQILKNAIKFIHKSFPEKDIEIEIESQLKDINVNANLLLLDVFENVIFNGIKYNENAKIEILTKISREIKNGTKYAKFEFIDNGIGVPDVMKQRIFKGISDRKEKVHGMGLGLLLVKRVLTLYNGEIWVEDKVKGDPSQGSNFIVLIPEVV